MDTIEVGKRVKPKIFFENELPKTQARRGSDTEHT
jgi:hypothetical protein